VNVLVTKKIIYAQEVKKDKAMRGEFFSIKQVSSKGFEGKNVRLRGWVYRKRSGKDNVFIILRDHSGIIQTVTKVGSAAWSAANKVTRESSVKISGVLRRDKRAPTGYEVSVDALEIVSLAERFPITKDQSPEFLLDNRHLWVRSRKITNVLKIRSEVFKAFREYFYAHGFYETNGPMFVGTKGEEGSELFSLKYFNKRAYLTQTSQMHLEAQIFALEKVFTIGPAFRAEKSRTKKHLTELLMMEAEMAWYEFKDLLKHVERIVSHACRHVAKHCRNELEVLGQDSKYLLSIKPPFKRLTYEQAVKELQKKGSSIKLGEDIGTEDERLLTRNEKLPVFITHWPRKMKAFYMKVDPSNPELCLSADLQAPMGYGELVGGSERETNPKVITQKLREEGDNPRKYKWYLDLNRYGGVPHSGYGLGTERFTRWICGLDHIRDATPFPRVINRLKP